MGYKNNITSYVGVETYRALGFVSFAVKYFLM